MRNMSFSLTTAQMIAGTKDVTRRLGWNNLRPGDHFMAVKKAMGLKKGEKIEHLYECEVISITHETLNHINLHPYRGTANRSEMDREGFPAMSSLEFCRFFIGNMKIDLDTMVNRVEFRRVV